MSVLSCLTLCNVEENHNKGYEIRETENALESWGFTLGEIKEKYKEKNIKFLKSKLYKIDEKSIRSMRAILAGVYTGEDRKFLEDLETQAEQIREQIRKLGE